ncbi:MAG: tRNA (N(6)-L-threonylcarbamoyladenosine(37)-C(2))-methylthiotransferase MtaB, partial [Oscillospiraceae bacterium]|nr:tRNA (N(6)-L-threonylcarbamoyladenosine(37)-C(2))-methylthiotransferase MtaB [Oscillospiraceae bacterium]
FMEACAFAAVHVYPSSPRPGTPAAGMPDQIENAEKHRRSVIAGDLARELSHRYAARMIGQDTDVLFERERDGFSYGHSPNYMVVRVPGTGLRNVVKTVHITGMDGTDLCGNIL